MKVPWKLWWLIHRSANESLKWNITIHSKSRKRILIESLQTRQPLSRHWRSSSQQTTLIASGETVNSSLHKHLRKLTAKPNDKQLNCLSSSIQLLWHTTIIRNAAKHTDSCWPQHASNSKWMIQHMGSGLLIERARVAAQIHNIYGVCPK